MSIELALYSADAEDAVFIETLATTCGFGCVTFVDQNQLSNLDCVFSERISFVRVTSKDCLQRLVELSAEQQIHLLCDKRELDLCQAAFRSGFFRGFILSPFEEPSEAARRYAGVLRAETCNSVDDEEEFLEDCVVHKSMTFSESIQRGLAVRATELFLGQHCKSKRVGQSVASVADELLMNAMFDAPVAERGEQVFASAARSTNLVLNGKQKVEMRLSLARETVAVTVTDYVGSLDRDHIMQYLAKSFDSKQEASTDRNRAGAGLGLSSIFRTGASLFFVCNKGYSTRVTAVFRLADNFKDFRAQSQFVSVRMS